MTTDARAVAAGAGKVVVEGVNVRTKHLKPSQQNPQGGRVKKEAPIHISNVMLADPQTGEPIKIPARKKVGFSVAKTFKESVLGKK